MKKDHNIEEAITKYLKSLDTRQKEQHNAQEVAEPAAYYGITYRSFLKNKMLVAQSISHGIPYYLFEEIQHQAPFSEEDWADFLNLSTKSLQRYKADGTHIFKPIHSEKIVELAEVTELGKEVFDEAGKFYKWLETPNRALAGYKPSELIKNSYGKELVMDELTHIDQGIFV